MTGLNCQYNDQQPNLIQNLQKTMILVIINKQEMLIKICIKVVHSTIELKKITVSTGKRKTKYTKI